MKVYNSHDIKNIALLGNDGSRPEDDMAVR